MEYGIKEFFTLLGGLAIFIYGMKIMSEGIQKVAGNSLRKILSSITTNKFSGLFVGFGLTTLVQSSSASTVMVVSFVNAGLMKVRQAIGVIMGANIGTTTTLWLVSLLGFSKFSISSIALPAAAIGLPLLLFTKRKSSYLGEFIFGFGLLFYGLHILKGGVPDYKHNPEELGFLEGLSHMGYGSVLLFILIGTLLTVVVQSSSAASTITIALVFQGVITFEMGAAMILGENIGTTITAYLAAIIGNVNAKRAARAHFLFNVIGVVWMLVVFYWFIDFIDYLNQSMMGADVSVVHGDLKAIPESDRKYPLALFHTSFNIINSLLLIWFIPFIEKLVLKWVPDAKEKKAAEKKISISNFIGMPEMAIVEAKQDVLKLAELTKKMFGNFKALYNDEVKKRGKVFDKFKKHEDATDEMEMEISNFLIDVTHSNSSEETSDLAMNMVSMANDLERIGDINYQLSKTLEKKESLEISFKKKMDEPLKELIDKVEKAYEVMLANLSKDFGEVDLTEAYELENEINALRDQIKVQHLKRLGKKEDHVQSGLIFRDLLFALEKMGDHIYSVNKSMVGQS